MRGAVLYEWQKLFGGRSKWLHLSIRLFTAVVLVIMSSVFEPQKTLVLNADLLAVTFIHGVNDLLYLSSMVYALWLSGKLFLNHASDIAPVQRIGRLRLGMVKWTLGALILCHYVIFTWLVALVLFNTAPYHARGMLNVTTMLWSLVFILQGFTLSSLITTFLKSPHTLAYVLGGLFMIDIIRAGVNRPEALDHVQYMMFTMLPSLRPSSDGTLIILVSKWLTMVAHGLFIIILSIKISGREY